MEQLNCLICNNTVNKIFHAKILSKYDINYYRCPYCQAIFTEKCYWSEESYSDAITNMDTGIMNRNILYRDRTIFLLNSFFKKQTTITGLDFAAGYGIMVRLLRDAGFHFYWMDKYAENLLVRGYEYHDQSVDVVTAFEVFEHFISPWDDLHYIAKANPKAIIFSTNIYDGINVPEINWWYWCFETGQHTIFYSKKTLEYIANKMGYYYYPFADDFHVFLKEKLSDLHFRILRRLMLGIRSKRQKRTSLSASDFNNQRDKLRKNEYI